MIQRLPFSYPGTDGDIARLETLMREAFALARMTIGADHPPLAVLNLACGRADESGALAAALKPARIGYYLGMDLRSDAIEEARQRWDLPGGEIDFREGNAAMIGRIEALPDFDLVFIRHQNYWHEPLVWEGILDEALAALKDGGHLVCTSYFDLEHELLLAALRTRGADIRANLPHPVSRPLPDAKGKSVDRWIVVAKTERRIHPPRKTPIIESPEQRRAPEERQTTAPNRRKCFTAGASPQAALMSGVLDHSSPSLS